MNSVEPPYIETIKGRKFYLCAPVFDAGEIAHALSQLCRYTGQCKFVWSVAQHSLLVADMMRELKLGDPFEGLMHDAHEAYFSDIASPWKLLLNDYRGIEHRLERSMRAQYMLPEEPTALCKAFDIAALVLEAEVLLPSGGRDWPLPIAARHLALQYKNCVRRVDIDYAYPESIARHWLREFKTYQEERSA